MNTDVQNNVGASQKAVVVAQTEISFAEKAKEMVCNVCESVKEFAYEVWEDEDGRKLLKDVGIALGVRLAFRHPLTAGIAIGIVGYRAWQEIKAAKEACTNN